MVTLKQIHAVVVFSDSPRTLADWYKRAFDVREVVTSDDFIGLHAGSVTLFVQRTSEGHRPGIGGIRPHFTVEDCDRAFRHLLEVGAQEVLTVTDSGDEWVAAVQDPEGNPIGLLSFKRPPDVARS
jgi:predicted enzyme related to lactoylglutathione lyase